MRPYKIVLGCTQILPALLGTESIKFQLYSQQDYNRVNLSVQNSIKILEQVTSDITLVNLPLTTPEVTCSRVSLPFISWYIRIANSDVTRLLNLVKQLFPKQFYIEVQ